MTIALFSPDPAEESRWAGVGVPVRLYRSVDGPSEADWQTLDVVILDLQLFRVGTSDADVDEEHAAEMIGQAASSNPDAFWLILSLPGLQELAAYRLRDVLFDALRAGHHATAIAQEPHSVATLFPVVQGPLNEIMRINAITVNLEDARVLEPQEERCVRRLLRDVDSVTLEPFGDGQGEAIVFRALCTTAGAELPPRILKVGPASDIKLEHNNYETYVRYKVGGYRFPHHDTQDIWFAGKSGALSYSLVGGIHPKTLVAVMRTDNASPALNDLFDHVLPPWLNMQQPARYSMKSFVDIFLDPVTIDDADQYWASSVDPFAGLSNPLPWLRDITSRVIDIQLPRTLLGPPRRLFEPVAKDGH